MKITLNQPLIKRNRMIGQITSFTSMGILAGGLIITFTNPEQIAISYGALVLGFILSQIGLFFSARFVHNPRPDEAITKNLKGLDDSFNIYHYTTPASHVLLTPNGIWLLFPYGIKGMITFEKGKYRHIGGSFFMKIFGQESLGRPDQEVKAQTKDITNFLKKNGYGDEDIPPIQSLLVFTNKEVKVDLDEAPVPGFPAEKIKEFIRKRAKDKPMPRDKFERLDSLFKRNF